MFGNMGIGEWLVVLVIILIFFGPKRLPGLAQALGKSVRELKSGLSGLTDELKDSIQADAAATKNAAPTTPPVYPAEAAAVSVPPPPVVVDPLPVGAEQPEAKKDGESAVLTAPAEIHVHLDLFSGPERLAIILSGEPHGQSCGP